MARELRRDWIVEGLMCFALVVTAPFVPLVLQSRVAFIPLLLLPEAALLLLVFRLCPALAPPPARAARRGPPCGPVPPRAAGPGRRA
jgi:hypothetical protein